MPERSRSGRNLGRLDEEPAYQEAVEESKKSWMESNRMTAASHP